MNTDSKTLRLQRFLATPGNVVTPMLAARKFNLYSLSQRMGELSDKFPVRSEWVKTKTSRYKKYWFNTRRGNA